MIKERAGIIEEKNGHELEYLDRSRRIRVKKSRNFRSPSGRTVEIEGILL